MNTLGNVIHVGNIFKEVINKNWFKYNKEFARCLKCFPILCGTSKAQLQIVEFIKAFYSEEIKSNVRQIIKPFELDIFIPNRNLAFEFDGLYYHSERNLSDNNYHLLKTEMCQKLGIQLIHIFENQWRFKKQIVKSRIKNLFGMYQKTIYARKCQIKLVDKITSSNFLFQNHIQGSCNSKINVGLFYQNQLISLMTFGKPRFNKKYEYELLRFCNLCNYHIPGAASKLLKYFEKNFNPKSMISYADRRWSIGNLYKKLGFDFDHNSSPDYWYWKNSQFSHRSNYQKHKLKTIKDFNYDELLSQVQNMINNGYDRIFDCGNMVFVKKYQKNDDVVDAEVVD